MVIAIMVCAFVFRFKGSALIATLASVGYGLIGFLDDFIKIYKKRSLGLRAYQKIIGQFGLAIIFAIYAYTNPFIGSEIYIPFTDMTVDIGWWYIPLIVLAVIATVNSTNLNDGIDGLLSSVSMVSVGGIAAIIYLLVMANEFEIFPYYSSNLSNLFTICGIVIGALAGFLMFNSNPAKVFMGDCGSMGIGGMFAALCILMKMPLLLIIAGGIYLIESVSVILQVASFKLFKKRIFKMAPIHHHFELGGKSETQVVTMFTIAQVFLSLLAILSILPLI